VEQNFSLLVGKEEKKRKGAESLKKKGKKKVFLLLSCFPPLHGRRRSETRRSSAAGSLVRNKRGARGSVNEMEELKVYRRWKKKSKNGGSQEKLPLGVHDFGFFFSLFFLLFSCETPKRQGSGSTHACTRRPERLNRILWRLKKKKKKILFFCFPGRKKKAEKSGNEERGGAHESLSLFSLSPPHQAPPLLAADASSAGIGAPTRLMR